MNLWGPAFFTDEELVAEIKASAAARRKLGNGTPTSHIRKVQGEGRMMEFAPIAESISSLDADLRAMLFEARSRGLPIGGDPENAIAVETGL